MKLLITALTISSITFVSGCGSGLPYVSEEDVIGSWTHQCDDNYDNCPSCDIYGDSEDKFYDLDKGSRAEFKVKYIYFNGNMALFDLVE